MKMNMKEKKWTENLITWMDLSSAWVSYDEENKNQIMSENDKFHAFLPTTLHVKSLRKCYRHTWRRNLFLYEFWLLLRSSKQFCNERENAQRIIKIISSFRYVMREVNAHGRKIPCQTENVLQNFRFYFLRPLLRNCLLFNFKFLFCFAFTSSFPSLTIAK